MNANQLIPVVEKAKSLGEKHLRIGDRLIHVGDVFKWKASYEQRFAEACKRYKRYRDNPGVYGIPSELIAVRSLMAFAAHDFCIYLRELGLLLKPESDWPLLPQELSDYPKLKEYWIDGFADANAQLYSNPD